MPARSIQKLLSQKRKPTGRRVAPMRSASPRAGFTAQHRRQRQEVERVAEQLFAAQGYRGTSIRQVALRAHCSVGQLYKLYVNKVGLFQAVFEDKVTHLGTLVEAAAATKGSPSLQITQLVRRLLGFFEENSAFFSMYEVETSLQSWKSHRSPVEQIGRRRQESLDQVREILREGQRLGEFRSEADCHQAAVTLEAMIKGHTVDWVWGGEKGSLVNRSEAILDLFLKGLRARGGRA